MQPEFSTPTAPVPSPVPADEIMSRPWPGDAANSVNATEPAKDPAPEEQEYIFVKMPNGAVVPVLKSDVHDAPSTEKQDAPAKFSVPVREEQYYVHLADGTVVRVNESDLPSGVDSPGGRHWQRGNKVFSVIGVYPVETVVSE